MSISLAALMRRVHKTEDCGVWTGHVRKDGYAVRSFWRDGKMTADYVHRLVYRLTVGPIPDGMHLDHLCRVRHCVNPVHLEPVSVRVNTIRGIGPTAVNALKTHCKHGHEFTPENTHHRPTGGRTCRECARAKCRRRAAAKRMEKSA